jgi:hypothetical protein
MSMFLGNPDTPLGKSEKAKEEETALAQLVKRDKEEDKNDSILTGVISAIGKSLTHNLEDIRRSTENTSSRLDRNNSSGPTKWIYQMSDWSSEKWTLDIIAEALGDILTSVENTEKSIKTSAIARHSDSPLETLMKKQHDAQKNNMSVKPDKNSQIINNIKAGTEPIAAGLAVILEAVLGDPGVVLKNYKEGGEGKEKDKDKPKTNDNAIKKMGKTLTNLILGKSQKEIDADEKVDAEKEVEDNKKDKDKAKNEKQQTGFLRKIWKNSKNEDRGWFAWLKKWLKFFLIGLAIWFTPLSWLKKFIEMPMWQKLAVAVAGLAAIFAPLSFLLGAKGLAVVVGGLALWLGTKIWNKLIKPGWNKLTKTPETKTSKLSQTSTGNTKPTAGKGTQLDLPFDKKPKTNTLFGKIAPKLKLLPFIGTLITLGVATARVANASSDEKAGKITKNEAIEEKGKAIGSGTGVLAGASVGGTLGALVGAGFGGVGAIPGAWIGSAIGSTLGALHFEPMFEELGGTLANFLKDEKGSRKTPGAESYEGITLTMSKEYKQEEYKKEGWRKNVVMAKEVMEAEGMGEKYTQEGFEREVREKKLDWLRDERKAARLGDDIEIDGQNKAERLEAYRMLETKTMAETYDDSSMLTTNESQEKLLKKLVDNTEPEKTKKEKPSQWSPFGHDKSAFKKQTSLGDRFKNLGEWLWGDKKKEETNEGPVHSYNSDNIWTSPTMGDGMFDNYSGTIPEANQAAFEPLFKEWQETVNQKIKVDESGGGNTPLYEQLDQKADDIKKQMRALELNTAQKASASGGYIPSVSTSSSSISSSSSHSVTLPKGYIASDEGWQKHVDLWDDRSEIRDAKEIAIMENRVIDSKRHKAGEPLLYDKSNSKVTATYKNAPTPMGQNESLELKATKGEIHPRLSKVSATKSLEKMRKLVKARETRGLEGPSQREERRIRGLLRGGQGFGGRKEAHHSAVEMWKQMTNDERKIFKRYKPKGADDKTITAQSSLGDRFKNLGKWLWGGDKKKSVAKKSSAIMDANKVTAAPVPTASAPMTIAQEMTKKSVNMNLRLMREGPKGKLGERAYRLKMTTALNPKKPGAKALWNAMKPEEQKQWKHLDPYKKEKARSSKFTDTMRTEMPGTYTRVSSSSSSHSGTLKHHGTSDEGWEKHVDFWDDPSDIRDAKEIAIMENKDIDSKRKKMGKPLLYNNTAKLNNTASGKSQTINGIHDENASLKEEKMSGINQTNVIDSSSKSSVNNSSQSIVTQPTATQTTTAFSSDWENF